MLALASSCRSSSLHVGRRRLLGPRRRRAADPDRRARAPRALALAPAAAGRGARTADDRAARRRSCSEHGADSLAYFALRRDKSTSSRRAAARSSPTASSTAPRSSPATRSATRPSGRARRASSAASRTRRAGASRSPARAPRRCRLRRARLQVDVPRRRGGDLARRSSRSTAARSARCASRSRGSRRPATGSRVLSTGRRRRGAARASSAPSRRSGAAAGPSAASRWRWTRSSLYPDTLLAVATAPDGSVGGFLQLVPSPACGGYSLASMRRRRDTPNGLMEYLIVETVAWARAQAVSEVSLNFSVFAEYLRADDGRRSGAPCAVLLRPTGSSSSSGCTASTASSSRTGGGATSASSAGPTCRSPGSRTCTPSRCSRRPGPWEAPGPRRAVRRLSPSLARPRGCSRCRRRAPRRARPGPTGRVRLRRRAHDVGPAATGITAANVGRLVPPAGAARRHRRLGADLPPRREGPGAAHDVFFVTTTYGKTEAIDAASGKVLWRFTPPTYSTLAGTAQITTMTPLADPTARRSTPASPTADPQARGRERQAALVDGDHARPDAREARRLAQLLARPRARRDRRLHRRRAAVPGPRRLAVRGRRARSSPSGTRSAPTATS